jgi:hypothetical protein
LAFQVIFGSFAKLVKTRSEQVAIGAGIADDWQAETKIFTAHAAPQLSC